MTRPSPGLLHRAAALLFLLVLPAYLAVPAIAWAQPYVTSNGSMSSGVTSTGVRCGDEVISFDTLNLPTEGANTARVKELAKLYAYAKEAWKACEFDKVPAVDRLPGCRFVRHWINERTGFENREAWNKRTLGKRVRLRALDAQLIAQATRVFAHNACSKAISKPGAEPSGACVELVKAEWNAKRAQHCEGTLAKTPTKPTGKAAKNPTEEQQKAATAEANRMRVRLFYSPQDTSCPSSVNAARDLNDEIERALEEVGGDRPEIEALPRGQWDAAKPIAPVKPLEPPSAVDRRTLEQLFVRHELELVLYEVNLTIYKVLLSSYEAKLADYEKRVAKLDWVRVDGAAEAAVGAAIEGELGFLRRNMPSDQSNPGNCKRSTYYVTPTGVLIENDHVDPSKPTICVDTSSFAIDHPFEVLVTAYPRYSTDPGQPQRPISIPMSVWPGEQTEVPVGSLKTESETDVVRITIRGYPRGVSLRALAQRGVDGSRFEGSFETTDLRVLARKVAEAKVPLETELAETAALDGLAAALGKDADVQKALKEMTEKVAAAAADKEKPEKNKAAAEAVNAARAAIEKFEKSYAEAPANAGKPAVTAAVTSAIGQLPDGLDPAKASLEAIQKVQAKLKEHQATLEKRALQQRGTQKSASDLRDDLDRRLARLCRIAKGLLPVVDEDVLIARTSPGVAAPGVYVIDYDYDAGFQRAPPRDLADTDRVYVRVRRVRPNEAVAIAINDKGVVQHAVSLVGYVHKDNPAPAEPSKDPVAHAGGLRLGINDLRPDDPDIQASSTQILALPRFDGARRYDFVLCGLTDRAGACPPGETVGKSRVIARNTLVVHSKRRLGVRAGVGFTGTFGEVRSLEDVPGSTLKYVRQQPVTLDAAVPLLLTYYFIPRDAVDMPRHFTMGLVAGPDMVATFQAKPRLYLGLALDFWGFGLTFGNLVEQRDTINAAAGSYLASAPTVKRWYGGAFLTLTTDLDIFEAVLRNYILSTPAPTVGNGGK